MAAVIGALRVVLGADTASFDDGLKSSAKKLKDFESNINSAGRSVVIGLTAAFVGVAAVLKSTINEMDNLGKQAQKIGIPVEQLSALRLVADLSGISMEQLGASVVKLSKNMEKAKEPFNEAGAAFRALNLSVKDSTGSFKSAENLILEIADRFAGMRDGVAKTALAIALFGKAGAEMIPFLNQGAKAIREGKEEAQEFGLVISTTTAKQAEQFNDNLTRLAATLKGIATQVTAHLLPVLSDWSARLVQVAKDNKFVETATEHVLNVLKEFALRFIDIMHSLSVAQVNWSMFWKRFKTISDEGLNAVNKEWDAALKQLETSSQESRDKIIGFFTTTNDKLVGTAAFWHKAAAQMAADFDMVSAAAERFKPDAPALPDLSALKKLNDQIESTKFKTKELQTTFTGLAPGFVSAASGMGKIGEAALETFFKTGQLTGQFAVLNTKMLEFRGAQLVWENRDPLVQWQTEMANVELAMRKVGATAEQIARAQERVAERFGASWTQVGASIAGTAGAMSQLTGTFAKENKAMGIASKAFGIGQAIINTQIAITKALATLPPPASYAAVALAVAQGAAAVAAISAQSFAKGGSFTVPGGVSGVDNTFVPMALASGERVTVETPEQQRQRTEIIAPLQGDVFSRRSVEKWLDVVNGLIADGYVLRVKPA